ncbi:MAG: PPC domain-containing DNA-binding protein [Candidatus Micrarchaeota archaeon]
MQYRNTGKEIAIRLDDGEEIIESLQSICKIEEVESALITGIGAACKTEIGHWDPEDKKYNVKKFEGSLEIISLNGNVAMLNNEPMVHIHIVIGKEDFSTKSGHLISAIIKPTCEIVLLPISTRINREKDSKTKLSLQKF